MLLDLFCGAGGCTAGYQRAGFAVTGVDINPQPRYCGDVFVQADALEYVQQHGHEYDVIHASPPCQAYSITHRLRRNHHPDLIAPVRAALCATGKPYVIENVAGAPLVNAVTLTGLMFGLITVRPRLFECSFPVPQPPIPPVTQRHAKMGRRARTGELIHVVGNGYVDEFRRAMGIGWMSRSELAQAIPPAYTEYIGGYLMAAITVPQPPEVTP